MTASCVSILRILLEIAAAAPGKVIPIGLPVGLVLGMSAVTALEAASAWRAIVIAVMANFLFKSLIVAAIGLRALAVRGSVAFGIPAVSAGLLLWLWPW